LDYRCFQRDFPSATSFGIGKILRNRWENLHIFGAGERFGPFCPARQFRHVISLGLGHGNGLVDFLAGQGSLPVERFRDGEHGRPVRPQDFRGFGAAIIKKGRDRADPANRRSVNQGERFVCRTGLLWSKTDED